ncbi:MAG: CoA transferase [Proteobacteria bacterium]|nr:CoA transferase [Pseudomonadota bacterium]
MSGSPSLLSGTTVLDLASVGPAARASRMLADYGARVVKIAPVSRRSGVQIEPPFHTYGAGRGFERVRIDLKADAGREAFLRLAAAADVVIESYRPGVVDRLGIGYEAVSTRNPGVVYCSTSGYGQTGPAADWAGHDINYLAMAGFLACCEPRADGGPPVPGATVADSAGGGMQAVIAILAALVARGASGRGRHLDVAAAEGVLSLMSLSVDQYLATGEVADAGATLLTGRYACYGVYACRDGRWLSVGAIEPHFYANLCRELGLEQYVEAQLDDARQDEIRAAFAAAFATRDRDEWVAQLAPANTCVAPVNTLPEVVHDEHFRARGVFAVAHHPEHGDFEQVGPVLAGGTRDAPEHVVRPVGETDTRKLLAEAGLSGDEIESLVAAGAVE